jgi:hypothetical protein
LYSNEETDRVNLEDRVKAQVFVFFKKKKFTKTPSKALYSNEEMDRFKLEDRFQAQEQP